MDRAISHAILWLLFSLSMMFAGTIGIRVTAAYTKGNELYLINAGRYVMLRARREVRRGPITELGLPASANVYAAVGGSTSADPTFFFTYNGVYHATGYEVSRIPSLIRSSIDAAGDRLGTQYFFKGCYYIKKYPRSSIWLDTRVRLTSLPCYIDAAWREGYSMVILKANKVWIWGHSGVTEPVDFSSRYTIRGSII